jgi:hypothetical protein
MTADSERKWSESVQSTKNVSGRNGERKPREMRGKEVNMNKEQRKLEEWWNKKIQNSRRIRENGATVNKEQRQFAVGMTKQSQG